MLITLNDVRQCSRQLKFSSHAKNEMLSEEFGFISEDEVKEAIGSGEIVEEYSNDRPYPSCLVYGKTKRSRPLHVVCAPVIGEELLVIITVYQPDPNRWIDFKWRKK